MKIKKSGCKLHYDPKVSIISPCYNGENYLPHFLDSLLCQDYRNVEFIFVDDGSTDKTREVFESYRKGLENKGWSVTYIWQENQGAAGALNTALKIFTGDYLIWPDSDDILYPDHIRHKVEFMEHNKDIGIAYCKFDCVYDENINDILLTRYIPQKMNMFKNIINDKNTLWPPIGNIVRTNMFLKINNKRDIPVCRGGQNCQIQLPIVYKYPYGVINKSLAKYVIRKDSHSHSPYNIIHREYDLAEIWIKTIYRLPCSKTKKIRLCIRVILHRSGRCLFLLFKKLLHPIYIKIYKKHSY